MVSRLVILMAVATLAGCAPAEPPPLGTPEPALSLNVDIHRRSTSNLIVRSSGEMVHAWASHVPTGDTDRPFQSWGQLNIQSAGGAMASVPLMDAFALVDPESPPQLAEAKNGDLFLAFSASNSPESVWRSTGVLVSRSTDGGATWSAPTQPGGAFGGYQNNHELHVSADGSVWIAWLDSRMGGEEGDIHVLVSRSTDNGATWSEPKVVDGSPSCECCRVAILTAENGTAWIAWRKRLEGGIRDIVVSRSDDGGASWSAPVTVFADDWVQGFCPDAGPTLAKDASGRLHVAWWTGKEGASGVKSVHSDNGGASFSDPIALSVAAASRASHVQFAMGTDNTLALVWDDGTLETPRVAVTASTDGGETWSTPLHLGPETKGAAYPHASFDGDGRLAVFWNERGTADMPSSLADPALASWSPANETNQGPRLLMQYVVLN